METPVETFGFGSQIEEMGFYTPAGARWARRISTPTAHAAHLFGVYLGPFGTPFGDHLGPRLGDRLETLGEQDGSKNMDFQRIWEPVLVLFGALSGAA